MKPVLVLRHGDDIPQGLLGEALDASGLATIEVLLHAGETIPPLDGFSGLVVLGGVMGAYDVDEHPWLADEKRLIVEAHRSGLPMLGICLGSQLFADALGGSAFLIDGVPEIGLLQPELTPAGAADPVVAQLDAPVISWHQDTWDAPPGATVLARSDRFDHAFRLGTAVAIQSHPEADSAIVQEWLKQPEETPMLAAAGTDPVALLEAVRRAEPAQREMAGRLFGAWAREVLSSDY